MIEKRTSTGAFDPLVGNRLCAVTFIWDYYQLLIGTEGLSIYAHPKVHIAGRWIEHIDVEYRDALCERIGAEVVAVSDDTEGMTIEFNDGATITISFLPKDRIGNGPESLVASNPQGHLTVVGDSEPDAPSQ